MQTKDHLYIGKYVADIENQLKSSHRTAFIVGCIEPDINFISYLKGSFTKKPLGGHSYESARKYMLRTIQALSSKNKWNTIDFFCFGRVIHYVIDSFTYPHNCVFTGSIREHSHFEADLHKKVIDYINSDNSDPVNTISLNGFSAFLTTFHDRYIEDCGSLETDCYFISYLSKIIVRLLPQKEAFTMPVTASRVKASRVNI